MKMLESLGWWVPSRKRAPIIFPSAEYVTERTLGSLPIVVCCRTTLATPPVWRSQLTIHSSINELCLGLQPMCVKIRLSGEKMSPPYTVGKPCGNSRICSRWRVAGSSISTVLPLSQVIAMNLSHGDQTTSSSSMGRVVVAVLASHSIGLPRMIRMKGWVCDSNSFRTIEFSGANTSAE